MTAVGESGSNGDRLVWRKASRCTDATCVEVAWRKSSSSTVNGCVEVDIHRIPSPVRDILAQPADRVRVRNSRFPDAAVLEFTFPEWAAFIQGVRNDEFNLEGTE
jgi:hypothetical protein